MTQEAERLITAIQQMESSLSDEKSNGRYELNRDDLRVTFPLNRCIAFLREKNDAMSKLHRERFEQVRSEFCLSTLVLMCFTNTQQNSWTRLSRTLPTSSHPLLSLSSLPLNQDLQSHQASTSHQCT